MRVFASLCLWGGVILGVWAQVPQSSPQGKQPQTLTNRQEAVSSERPRLEGVSSLVFEGFDRVSVRNYEAVALQEVIFTGNVRILFEGKRLSAQRVYVTIQSNKTVLEIAAFDEVEFRDGNTLYLAESFFYQPEKKTGRMRHVRSYLRDTTGTTTSPGLFYRAEEVEILSDKRAVFKKAYLTFTPAEIPHYELYAEKVWYFRDDVIFSLHNTYTVGQQRLFYFPFFLRLERVTGIKTAAGIEKRIGWYIMNTMDWSPSFGTMQFGLDIYERMGEYGFVRYVNKKPIGVFQQIRFFGETADDVRLFYDASNDRYSQWIQVNNEWTTVREWSWHYMLEGTLQKDTFALTFYTEDLNDPFFTKKYSQRRDTFNIQHILQPEENKFFSQSDNSPGFSSLTRRFTITSPQLTLNGQWIYSRKRNESISNSYRNDAYSYYLYQVSFPNISYTLPTIPLLEETSLKTFWVKTHRRSERITRQGEVSSSSGSVGISETRQTNERGQGMEEKSQGEGGLIATQEASLRQDNTHLFSDVMETNSFEWASVSSSFNGNLSYTSSETLDTNTMPVSDSYHHQENASVGLSVKLLNKKINWDHALSLLNRKRWSSFEVNYSNNILYSGAQVDYTMRTSTGETFSMGNDPFWRVQFPFSVSHVFQYQVFRSIYQTKPREYSHSVSASTGCTWLSNMVVYKLSYTYATVYRITNGVEDEYLNNQIQETMGASTSLQVWWFSSSTGVTLDTLTRRNSKIVWQYPEITNRISGTVVWENAFVPVAPWTYIPSVRHRYDLLKQTNLSLAVSSYATLANVYPPFVYKVEALTYQANLLIDYLSPRSSSFSLSVGTGIWLQKYWKLDFATQVVNRKLYRYDYAACGRFNEPYVNFWKNLWDGLNIFDYQGLQRSFFKIQALNFSVTHYLNEWEMRVGFTIQRQLDTLRRIAYWEPQIRVEFMLSGTRDQFPPYTKRFVPQELQ
ncbi:MAG: hypothetical protein N2314_00590 [Brevinematales bacterium]|nr:hypothetical protein [Brevinematales bacterium]